MQAIISLKLLSFAHYALPIVT